MLDFTLAYLSNISALMIATSFCSFAILVGTTIAYFAASSDQDRGYNREASQKMAARMAAIRWPLVAILLVSSLTACLPSVDELWKVRLGLLKFELASPQNVQKGTEEIERIAKKLECRYLGCPDETKKEGQK